MSFQVSFKSLVCTSDLANTTWCNIGWPPSVPCHLQPFKPELPTETQQHHIENTKYQATASEPSSPLGCKDGGAWIENNKNRSQAWNVSSINTNPPIFTYLSYTFNGIFGRMLMMLHVYKHICVYFKQKGYFHNLKLHKNELNIQKSRGTRPWHFATCSAP